MPPSQPGTRATAALIGAVVGAVVAALIAGIVVAQTRDKQDSAVAQTSSATVGSGTVGAGSPNTNSSGGSAGLDVRGVLRTVEPSVVSVRTDSGEGSGFVISTDGFVVTNAHVIEGASRVQVRFADGQTEAAEVVGSYPDNDVALLKLSDPSGLVPAKLGSSASLQVGDSVMAIGNALGLGAAPSVTLGIVSATDRRVPVEGAVLDHLIQTDAAINHGNSGGPLVDSSGAVVGISTLTADGAQSIGFAIAIDSVKPLIEDLKAGRGEVTPNTAFLGVSTIAVDDPTLDPQDLSDKGVTSTFGAFVVDVTASSPADKAGIRVGDVITAIDRDEVRSPDDVGTAVRSHKVGDRITVRFEHRGVAAEKAVVLARKG